MLVDKDFGNGGEKMTNISNGWVKIYQVKPRAALDDITENHGQYSTKGIHSFDNPGFTFMYKHLKR